MITLEITKQLLGWCLVINLAILVLTSLLIIVAREPIAKLHAKMFGIDEAVVALEYFRYLANYKIAILILNLTPYIALVVI